MKIEKKKVVKSSKLSNHTKSAVAAALGIAASFGTTACDDSISAIGGDDKKQGPEPTCGEVVCGNQLSSSSYTDISSSGEHLSSEAIEALSSSVQTPSSSSYEPIIEAGILPPYEESSSSVAPLSSSEEEPIMLSGDIAPYEDPTSSSVEAASSSSKVQSSSSRLEVQIEPVNPDTINKKRIIEPIFCEENDPSCYNIRLCKDPEGCMIYSMVTTFEQDDIQA
ncbi:MAG: hypothetical protein IJM92_04100 [Fibrobacter sp.]|uniref:hypothetical protein n=1 Tax=Fibrobacter sp. TaxID=35828 RepID=UPI0025C6DD85|nr:hypothetical protein [Fibrobacter sp.]MBQ7078845.1 hypothetical protein [Fibrobacter sp.]